MSIYTKQGDNGLASTVNRRDIPKNHPVFHVLGTLDELSGALGTAKFILMKPDSQIAKILETLQQDISTLSAAVAGAALFPAEEKTAGLESSIDAIMEALPPIRTFILPGKTAAGAALDIARSVARRLEREAVELRAAGGISKQDSAYLNRLSDMIFALARMADSIGGNSQNNQSQISGKMNLETAKILCNTGIQKAAEMNVKAVCAVCGAEGNLICLQRDDEALLGSVDIAINKAYTSAALKMTTERLSVLAAPGGELYGIQNTNGGKIVIFGGGVPLERDGKIVGAVGISGGTAEQDSEIAKRVQESFL